MVKLGRWVGLLANLSLVAMGFIAAPMAQAAPITTQPYLESSGITALHAQGLDGTGVKIAVIDGPVDTSVPELQGVVVIQKTICHATFVAERLAHATAIASILSSPAYGWAPNATILSYSFANQPDGDVIDYDNCPVESDSYGYLIHQALNDGADVIVISSGGTVDDTAPWALVRAMEMGVPVVIAMGNDSTSGASTGAIWNTTVGVGALDATGQKADYSNYGEGLTVMAYGGPLTMRDPDGAGKLNVLTTDAQGTSFSGPMVAGALALAKQKWPTANGNQLTRVLADTADGTADHMSYWNEDMGFGTLNASLLVATDPTGYDTSNSFMDKTPGGTPSPQDIHDYDDGLVDPFVMSGYPGYVYRGCDPYIIEAQPHSVPSAIMSPYTAPECRTASPPAGTTEPKTSETTEPIETTPASSSSPWILIGVAAGVVVLAAIVLAVWMSRRRRPRGPSSAPYPGAHSGDWYPGQPFAVAPPVQPAPGCPPQTNPYYYPPPAPPPGAVTTS